MKDNENIDIKYANAFSETLEILKFIPKEDYEKIPIELIEVFEDYMNKDYEFKYNFKVSLNEQDVLEETKVIIAILFRDYWSTEKQKEIILKREKYENELLEKEKQEKYNIDVFNNLKEEQKVLLENNEEKYEIALIEKRSILKALLFKIKNFLKREK